MKVKRSTSFFIFYLFTSWIANAQSPVKNPPGFLIERQVRTRNNGDFLYNLETSTEPYANLTDTISVNEGEIWDEPTYYIPLSFPFTLNGHNITGLSFYGSGALLRAPTGVSFADTYVFPFETDLIDRGANGSVSLSPISYKTEGPTGNQIQKIEFNNAGSYWEMHLEGTLEMYINFQLWLYEGSNRIEFRFGPSSIDVPTLFYGGLNGASLGVIDYDEFLDLTTNPHYLVNNPSNPILSLDLGFLNGTPVNGTVYALDPIMPLAVDATGTNSTSVCLPNGSAVAVVSGGMEPYEYNWSNGSTTDTISSLSNGIYHVTVEDAAGAMVTDSVEITSPAPLLSHSGSTGESSLGANDGTAWADESGGLVPYGYLWSTGDTIALIENLPPGMYSVIITDAAGCVDHDTVTVEQFVCPALALETSIQNASCYGYCNGQVEITGVMNGAAPFTFGWANGDTIHLRQDLCAGSYEVTVTDSLGCTITDTILVTEPQPLLANAGSTPETIAGGDGTAWAVPLGGTPPYGYRWNNGSTDSLITNLAPDLYTITVTDASGCADSQMVEVVEFVCFTILIDSVQIVHCHDTCDGLIEIHIAGGVGPFQYAWTTGDTTPIAQNLCAQFHSVTVTDVGQGCSSSIEYEITQPDSFYIFLDVVDHLTDSSQTAIRVSIYGGVAPYVIGWTGPNAFFSVEEDLVGIEPGWYTLQVQDLNGCIILMDSVEVRDETVRITHVQVDNILLQPNPANETLVLAGELLPAFETILMAVNGQEIAAWKNQPVMDVSWIPSGFYVLHVIMDGRAVSVPLVIQH